MTKPYILLSNQSTGPLFQHVVDTLSRQTSVTLFNGIRYDKTNFFKRIFTWTIYSVQLFFHLIRHKNNYSHVLIVTNPPLAPLLSILLRCPFSILVYDLYPETLTRIKGGNILFSGAISLFIKIWMAINNYIYARAENVFCITPQMLDYLQNTYSSFSTAHNLVCSPLWATSNNYFNEDFTSLKGRQYFNFDPESFICIYSGNLGLTHNLIPLLDTACLCQSSSNNIKFYIVGNGPQKKYLISTSSIRNIDRNYLEFMDFVDYSDLPLLLKSADLAVVTLESSSSLFSLPSKTFTYMACRLPIICIASESSSLACLVKHYKCGWIFDPLDIDLGRKIYDLTVSIQAGRINLEEFRNNSYNAYLDHTPDNVFIIVNAILNSSFIPNYLP